MRIDRTLLSGSGLTYVLVQLTAKISGFGNLLLIPAITESAGAVGEYAAWVLLAAAITLIADRGCAAGCLRSLAVSKSPARPPSVVRSRLRSLTVVAIPAVVLSLGFTALSKVVFTAVALGLVMGINTIIESYLLGSERFILAAMPNLLFNMSVTGILAVALLTGTSLTTLGLLRATFCGAVVAAAAGALPMRLLTRRLPLRAFYEPLVAARAAAANGTTFVATQIDLVVLALCGSSSALAVYSFASRFANVATSLPQLLAASRQPMIARALTGSNPIRPVVNLLTQLVAITAGIAFLISVVLLLFPSALPSNLDGVATTLPILLGSVPSFGFQAAALAACRTGETARISAAVTALWLILIGVSVAIVSLYAVAFADLRALVFLRLLVDVIGYSTLARKVTDPTSRVGSVLSVPMAIGSILSGLWCLLFPFFAASAVSNAALTALSLSFLVKHNRRRD
jgi:hypothetical protein